MDYYEEWLAHHGVKGQRWGVRRYQNADGSLTALGKKHAYIDKSGKAVLVKDKDIKKDNAKQYDKYLKEEYSKLKIDQKRKEAFAFGERWGLDLDDGGGGNPRAGKKYLEMWDEIERLEESASGSAKKRATDAIVNKYGSELYNNFKKREDSRNYTKITAAMGALFLLPVAVVALPLMKK